MVVMWAVMCGTKMYPGSLSFTWEGATSYLGDARHESSVGARLVKVTIEDVAMIEDESGYKLNPGGQRA